MPCLEILVAAWDEAHREFAIALAGMPDADLWRRPDPRLLSVGEICGHVAYWQAVWTLGGGDNRPDLARLPLESPFLDHRFRYYSLEAEDVVMLNLSAEAASSEVERVHRIAKDAVSTRTGDEPYPGQWGTWGQFVQYQVFHVAYHTGQIYSARHLMGHETEDN